MANTVYGPFNAINVVNGTTPANATWGNNVQTQASVALNGLNGDLYGPFVLSGIFATKDGTIANQLDVTSGLAYARMSDNSVARITTTATTFTTSTPSTTYYLDLNPDASWSWGTAHSAVANHLLIAQCATDGSGNVSSVTDNRSAQRGIGAPLVVAQAVGVAVTTTSDQQIISYSPPVDGIYRASISIAYRNPTPQKMIARLDWGEPTLGVLSTNFFRDAWDNQWLNGSQANVAGNNQGYACESLVVHAVRSVALNVNIVMHFQDPGGTPNDAVSAVIERIA